MKIKGLIITAGMVLILSACSQTNVGNVKLETAEDSLSYAIGVTTYEGVTKQGWDIDPKIMAKGMMDAENGEPVMNGVASNGFITIYMRKQQEENMKDEFSEVIEEGNKFLAENLKNEGIEVTESGLQYKVIVQGDGEKPQSTDKVRVHYTGTLIDGTKFDSSVDRGEPAEFKVTGVIPGWVEGLQLMPVGSKYMLYIPYNLGYGARGAGATIKPFSTLIFEVELLDIITEE